MKFFRIPFNSDEESGTAEARNNRLQKYIHAQSVQDMSRLAAEISPDVRHLIGANVQALLGYLPASEFNTTVVASKENLQNLLASAMLTGFFMHSMETRMQMESLFEAPAPTPELQAPETLFAQTEALLSPEPLVEAITEALADPTARQGAEAKAFETEALFEENRGRFLSIEELEADNVPSEKLNIQLEINTRMNRTELARLLRELREFQDRYQHDDSGDPNPKHENERHQDDGFGTF